MRIMYLREVTKSFNIVNVLDFITEIRTEDIEDMDVLDHMKNIDNTVYEYCYTGPMSSSYVNYAWGIEFYIKW